MLIKNATIVLPAGERDDGEILIENGRIVRISRGDKIETNAETIDLAGAKLFAGFIDVHNHGAIGVDANDADADALHSVSKFLAKQGVTAWLPTFVPDSDANYQKCAAAVDELMRTQIEREPAAQVVGVHYEGPFVSEKQCGALRVEFFRDFADGEINLPKLKTPHARHLITLAPEIAGGIDLIAALKKQGWIISIGHTRAGIETLNAACSAGARHLTHFFNAMSGLHHRSVGVVGWGLTRDEITFDIIGDGVHVERDVLRFACRAKSPDKVVLISDSVAPTGLGDGEFTIWNEKISVSGRRTENGRGSIAGSVITIRDAVKNLLELGFTAPEVSKMASANPARLLKIEQEAGTIEIGKRADLTAVNENGETILTIIGGRKVTASVPETID